jgi:hypothetical protein
LRHGMGRWICATTSPLTPLNPLGFTRDPLDSSVCQIGEIVKCWANKL